MITTKAEYLLKILVDLAGQPGGEYVVSGEIAERQGIPPKYVPQLVALLSRKGWIASQRGAGGGVRLAVNPASITVRDVVELAQGPTLVKACVSPSATCHRKENCPLFPLWAKAQRELDDVMAGTTLADLVRRDARE